MSRVKKLIPEPVKKPLRKMREKLRRMATPPLETLPNAPDLFGVYRWLAEHPEVERRPGGWFYKGKLYPDYLTVGGASCAIFRVAQKHCRGRGIDVGAGLWPLPGATPVDIWRGPGAGKTVDDFASESLDFLFSSHCLEHIENWRAALAEWVGKVKPGGIVFLYLPHPECGIWERGSPFVGDEHKWSPTPTVIEGALQELGCAVLEKDAGPDAMYSFYVCARKLERAVEGPHDR